jgi:hypothetical protein
MEEGEVCMKKRILVLLSAVATMVVMLAMSVAPAFAAGPSFERCLLIARHQAEIGHGNLPHFCQA